MKFSTKILTISTLALGIIPSVFAAISITPSQAPGTFDHAIKLELNASDPAAKIFYSFNPDGGPNEALAYTGPILLKSSTPLVYFGFVSIDNESKVLIDDYIFDYPTLSFTGYTQANGGITAAKIYNPTEKDIDISYWEIHAQDYSYIIPENTILKSKETYILPDIPLNNAQAALLQSPDGDTKDIIVAENKVAEILPPVQKPAKKTFVRSTVRELAPEIWIKPKLTKTESKTAVTVETEPTEITPTETPTVTTEAPTEVVTPIITPPVTQEPKEPNLADNLKVAVNEGTQENSNAPWIIIGIVIISISTIGVRYILKK